MGYGGIIFKTLSELRRKGTLAGIRNVIDLGAQEAFLDHDQFDHAVELLKEFGVENPDPAEVQELLDRRFVRYLWERAGIAYASVDLDAQFETLLLDLNYDDVPPAHRNNYDLVTNCGTTEHVINQMNAFRIMHDLTRPGGYMLHDLPWSGMFNHGLFNYKPHLFWRLCQSNGYNWIGMSLRAELHDPVPLPDNILASCNDRDLEIYKKYFAHNGTISVVLQKPYGMPFVCPLDMESGMVFPGATAKRRYWTLAEPEAFANFETYCKIGFPNDEQTANELRVRCRDLQEKNNELQENNSELQWRVRWMEGSRFWRLRGVVTRWKNALLLRSRDKVS